MAGTAAAMVRLTERQVLQSKYFLKIGNIFRKLKYFLTIISGTDTMIAAKFTCEAATYLGARYPRGIFGAVESSEETAVRFFHEWNDQVQM